METRKFLPNRRNLVPNENEYLLVFMPDRFGIWRELGHEIPKYNNMILADYLSEIGLIVPDYCQFMRIISDEAYIVFRAYDCMRVTIYYSKNIE